MDKVERPLKIHIVLIIVLIGKYAANLAGIWVRILVIKLKMFFDIFKIFCYNIYIKLRNKILYKM